MSEKPKTRKTKPEPKRFERKYPRVIEIFSDPSYQIDNLERDHRDPSVFNGFVNYRKYRVTVERIEEPNEVLCERLQKLWDECDNHHQWIPLKNAAARVGLELNPNDFGKKRKASKP